MDYNKIDFKLLRKQKQQLLEIRLKTNKKEEYKTLDGVINLINNIQDYAVNIYNFSEKKVFGNKKEIL